MLPQPGCGNPLFLNWIKEWHSQVQGINKNYAYTLKKAIDALSKYPLPLEAKETIQLNGIGPKIAAKLEKKWQEHLKENPSLALTSSTVDNETTEGLSVIDSLPSEAPSITEPSLLTKTKKKRATAPQLKEDPAPKRKKEYVPHQRTGAFAILLALRDLHAENQTSSSFPKDEVMERAQSHCDVPMDKPLPGKHYSGWSSIKTLVLKELVYTVGRPAKYALSDTGKDLSERLSQVNNTIENVNATPQPPLSSSTSVNLHPESSPPVLQLPIFDITSDQLFRLLPGEHEIVLVLDNREVRGKKDRDYFQTQLEKKGIVTTTRSLSLGDALWIARPQVSGGTHEEVVLDFIVERKKMDDLASSIKDGRFKEQKFRLKNCGAKKVIYLVEGFNIKDSANFALQPQSFWTCLAQTLVGEGFCLKMTHTMEDTLDYLARLTRQIKSLYEGRVIEGLQNETISRTQFLQLQDSGRLPRDVGLTLATFLHINDKSKHMTLTDVFLKMLMTCRGLSLSKASQILKKYPTPASMVDAFLMISPSERDSLLAISSPIQSRSISQPLAKKLYSIWRPRYDDF